MQITEQIIERIARRTFNSMFAPALRQSNVVTSGPGSSVSWADNAGHANSADSLTDLSQIENMLADYVSDTELETTLASYATKTWVDQNYLSLSFFNALFQARTSQGAVVAPNSGDTTTIDNIKAMFGFWTDQYISALGQGADGGGPVTTLARLNDVQLSLPLADGEVLTYSSALGKWTNGAGVSVAWNDITGKPTTIAGFGITDAHITNGVITLGSNSITPITSLSGYATESWVNTQLGSYVTTTALGTTLADYVTTTALGTTLADYGSKTWIDNNYISKAFFNRLFRAFAPVAEGESEAAQVEPNDVTTEIDNIKAMFGLWTEQYLSALGLGSDAAPSGASALSGLTDVAISSLADKDLLQWDYATGKWKNVVLSTVMSAYALASAIPTNVSQLNNDSGYITGITSSMVTTALGYTPANSSSLSNYLPLSGGTISNSNRNCLNLNNTSYDSIKGSYIGFKINDATYGYVGIYLDASSEFTWLGTSSNRLFLDESGGARIGTESQNYTIWHAGNLTNNNQLTNGAGYITSSALSGYATEAWANGKFLTLSGGTITRGQRGCLVLNNQTTAAESGPIMILAINNNSMGYVGYYNSSSQSFTFLGAGDQRLFLDAAGGARIGTDYQSYTVYHAGNLSPITTTNWSSYIGTSTSPVGYATYDSAGNAISSTYVKLTANGTQTISNSAADSAVLTLKGHSTYASIAYRNSSGSHLGIIGVTSTDGLYFYDSALRKVWHSGNSNGIDKGQWSATSLALNGAISGATNITASGNVGIGVSNPTYKLDVKGNIRICATYADRSTIYRFLNHDNNPWGLIINTEGTYGGFSIQNQREANDSDCMPILFQPLGGNFGIGVALGNNPAYKLHVVGDIYATGGVTALSDIRKKDVIAYELPLSFEQIAAAPTIKFLWKDKREKGEQVGTIAQYWQNVLPWVIKDKSGELSMQYGVAALISSITIARKVVNHEERISALEKENADLKQAYSFIKNAYDYLKMDYENLKLKIA